MDVKIYIGKVKTSEEYYVYDSKGFTFQFFSTYEKAVKQYEKLKDIFSIRDGKNTYLDILKNRRAIEYSVYREYRNKILSGDYTEEDKALERTRYYSYQLIEDLIDLYVLVEKNKPVPQG